MNKSSQMRLVDAGTLCLFAHIFITQYKYQIITQITLILRSVSGSGYVTHETIVHILIFPKLI